MLREIASDGQQRLEELSEAITRAYFSHVPAAQAVGSTAMAAELMHYLLSHRTTYTYASSVDSAHHIAHLRARAFPGQTVTSIGITTHPAPSMAVQHVDHFGNLIDILRIDQPHQRFDIEVRAAVEVSFPVPPPANETPPWEEIAQGAERRRLPQADRGERVRLRLAAGADRRRRCAAYGAQSFTPGRPILEAARELTTRIKADFEYHPGATDISTPLHEVFAGKAGVCQDFAHVMIAALRAHGLAAGYVSGYIRTVHSTEEIALRGADASHAWVAVWCGERPAGSISTRPTTWSRTRTMSPSPGAATSPT